MFPFLKVWVLIQKVERRLCTAISLIERHKFLRWETAFWLDEFIAELFQILLELLVSLISALGSSVRILAIFFPEQRACSQASGPFSLLFGCLLSLNRTTSLGR